MRPAATCVRTCSTSDTGINGVSIAGFSARAALTARAFERFDLRAVVGTSAEFEPLFAPFGTGSTKAADDCCPWSIRFSSSFVVGVPISDNCSAVPIGVAETISAAAELPELRLFLFRLLRLFRELASAVGSATRPISTGIDTKAASVGKAATSASIIMDVVALSGTGPAVNNATRGTRPASLRRPPRLTDSSGAITKGFLSADSVSRLSETALVSSNPAKSFVALAESVSCPKSPSANRRAFLRAVRFAPPRERRFFFFAGSSSFSASFGAESASVNSII